MGGKPRARRGQVESAGGNRDISVSEFFAKNRHLLGFDSPQRALLTAVKEAVDNSLDACEEAEILPEVWVGVTQVDGALYKLAVEDNGPGIDDHQIARIFGKLLYGSKFHKLAQSRGQQGLGISAAGMYAQLTSGKPVRIVSRRSRREPAREAFVSIDTARNRPEIHSEGAIDWRRSNGTRVEMTLEGQYQHGQHSIALYLKLTAIANPHVSLHLLEPDGSEVSWERTTNVAPPRAQSIKPHPHGVEIGRLISMLKASPTRRLGDFLREEFSQVGVGRATEIVRRAGKGLTLRSSPRRIARLKARALHSAIANTAISAPRTDCVVPIGEVGLLDGLAHEVPARFMTAITRKPSVYRGNPFVVEVALGYGDDNAEHVAVGIDGRMYKEGEGVPDGAGQSARLLRYANRVPLLFQQGHCAMTKAVTKTNWRRYGLEQSSGGLPRGPLTLIIHLASVWVPFTSESKEAIASYDEIVREIELALHEAGRRLATVLRKENRLEMELQRRTEIERYLPHVGDALSDLLGWNDDRRDEAVAKMDTIVHRTRKAKQL